LLRHPDWGEERGYDRLRQDTRVERLAHDSMFVRCLASKAAASPTVRRALESYSQSMADPDNELVHLYEIRDTAGKHFGTGTAARNALGISKTAWSALGRLANDDSLRQGRHRGTQIGGLRDATHEELQQARTIARGILEALARVN
jgi:hypothetical protein